ncbi:hypothetical protein [Anaerotruncus colihominis]|uniref:Uncharacterized protein n=1 Tax=Anaerotruncus colihominis TaxID=169435 RepID=A0A845SSM1_9FIRM|nr:hypothetical protein [Anaerotruncus colihominis]MCR2025527.1 hypothetical protein [Anaerotruncus colihominis]NDO37848.1 hypothetical protein [Anaerotruncus colihominis]
MYESERRRTAPFSSPHVQQPLAGRAMSARMARTDAVQRPVEPPNPPIVESAQPVLPLGGAPVQARISPGSKPERIARRRAQRDAQPAVPDGEAIAAMEYEVNHPITPPPEPTFGENENNPPPEAALGELDNNPTPALEAAEPAARRPGFWDREYAEGSVLGGIQSFRNRYLSLEGAAREDYRDDIAHFIGRVPTRDEVQDNRARGVTGFNAQRHPLLRRMGARALRSNAATRLFSSRWFTGAH